MQAIFRAEGRTIDHTPSGNVSAGDVIVLDDLIGVATRDIAADALGALAMVGVVDVAKKQESFDTIGGNVYWDDDGDPYNGTAGSGAATATAADGKLMGRVLATADATDETVRILLVSRGEVVAGELADALADAVPSLSTSFTDNGDGTGTLTIQAKDAQGNDLAEVVMVEAWVGGADDHGEDAITGVTIATGTQREELTANAAYRVISDVNGTIVLTLDNNGAGSLYGWAEADGKVYATGEMAITA